jgi:NifB/MoaA-like Fe-S oxidoreductase
MVLELVEGINLRFGDGSLTANVYGIKNNFFGPQVTVSGLVTGNDILEQLAGKDIGTELLLPENMFKSGEDIMLDDTDLNTISNKLGVKAIKVRNNGKAFLNSILGTELKRALMGHKYSILNKNSNIKGDGYA